MVANAYPGDGTVFELSPPANPGEPWTHAVLFDFNGNDGIMPYAGMLLAQDGSLYGTTDSGGLKNAGTLFQLVPPSTSGGTWGFRLLHHFGATTGDGLAPLADLLYLSGTVYGTTDGGGSYGYGAVFSWAP